MSENGKIDKAFSEVVSYHSSIPMITKDYFCAGVRFGLDEGFSIGIESGLKKAKDNIIPAARESMEKVYDRAFNHGIDAVKKSFDSLFLIKPDLSNLLQIVQELNKVFDNIEKLKK